MPRKKGETSKDGRPRDPVDGGVDPRARRQDHRLREEVLREGGGGAADQRGADNPRRARWHRHTRGHDNGPGAALRAPQSHPH